MRSLLSAMVFVFGVVVGAVGASVVVQRVMAPSVVTGTPQSDAVVVLAGSPADRVEEGLRLVEEGAAEVLVLSVGVDAPKGWAQVGDLCDLEREFVVHCVVPQSRNTIGEAATISRLAEEQGWASLALVTSRYHLDRATIYFESCFDGEILPVASEPARITWPLLRHEMLGAVHARTIGQHCPTSRPVESPSTVVAAVGSGRS